MERINCRRGEHLRTNHQNTCGHWPMVQWPFPLCVCFGLIRSMRFSYCLEIRVDARPISFIFGHPSKLCFVPFFSLSFSISVPLSVSHSLFLARMRNVEIKRNMTQSAEECTDEDRCDRIPPPCNMTTKIFARLKFLSCVSFSDFSFSYFIFFRANFDVVGDKVRE